MEKIDLTKIKKIFFVGIKGVAMTALAILAKEKGISVSGSDTVENFPTKEELKAHKIKVIENFDPENINRFMPDLVIYTGAHGGKDNPEVRLALRLGVPVLPHGRALGIFMSGKKQVSVAGSHGKTTAAAMISVILKEAGLDPSYAVGCGEIFGLGAAGHSGKANLFIAEADEYMTDPGNDHTPRFAWQHPEILVVTNVDFDHPDAYRDLDEVQEAFKKFRNSMSKTGQLIMSADDKNSAFLADTSLSVLKVGLSPDADYQVTNIHTENQRLYFNLNERGVRVSEFMLEVPGKHNAVNAGMAAVAANLLGISWKDVRLGLTKFFGTKRRFEKLGEGRGAVFYDDYAHHPRELTATLKACREWYPKSRLIAVFQPHTYSRTKALLDDFARAFKDADIVILTDIYASAREKNDLGMSGRTLVDRTREFKKDVIYAQNPEKVFDYINDNLRSGDIVIFMGAGDIYNWDRETVKKLLL